MKTIECKNNWRNTERYLLRLSGMHRMIPLQYYAEKGLSALIAATPVKTGLTANSWSYEIVRGKGYAQILYLNSNIQNGIPIVLLLQNGHATKYGGWVEGHDFITEALQPVFGELEEYVQKEVTKI